MIGLLTISREPLRLHRRTSFAQHRPQPCRNCQRRSSKTEGSSSGYRCCCEVWNRPILVCTCSLKTLPVLLLLVYLKLLDRCLTASDRAAGPKVVPCLGEIFPLLFGVLEKIEEENDDTREVVFQVGNIGTLSTFACVVTYRAAHRATHSSMSF